MLSSHFADFKHLNNNNNSNNKSSIIIDKSKLGVSIHCVSPPMHFFIRQKLFLGETLCYLWETMLPQWSPCFLVLPMLLVWHYTTQWSSGTSPVLLAMPCQWSTSDQLWVLLIWESDFYSKPFFNVHSFLLVSRVPWSQQFNLKVRRASCWSSKHCPSLFLWITTIHNKNMLVGST